MRLLAAAIVLDDDLDDDIYWYTQYKPPRVHQYWMAPFLSSRREIRIRRSLAYLEDDFIRVSLHPMLSSSYICTVS